MKGITIAAELQKRIETLDDDAKERIACDLHAFEQLCEESQRVDAEIISAKAVALVESEFEPELTGLLLEVRIQFEESASIRALRRVAIDERSGEHLLQKPAGYGWQTVAVLGCETL